MMRPAVFLALLLLCGCKSHAQVDFEQAWNTYEPVHVAGADGHTH